MNDKAAQEAKQGNPKSQHTGRGWLLENLEVIIIAVALSFIVRCFVVEPFQIPTGSMANTLMGHHVSVKCSNCGYPVAVGMHSEEDGYDFPDSLVCPLCETKTRIEYGQRRGLGWSLREMAGLTPVVWGDRILAHKLAYSIGSLKRYDVAVFKAPDSHGKNYIKRVVGLPGDIVQIKNGNIYIDGALARKSAAVQQAVWNPLYDSRYTPHNGLKYWEAPSDGDWIEGANLLRFDATALGDASGMFWARLRHPLTDFQAYNSGFSPRGGKSILGEVRFVATVPELAGQGTFVIAVVNSPDRYEVRIPVGRADERIEMIHMTSTYRGATHHDDFTGARRVETLAQSDIEVADGGSHTIEYSHYDGLTRLRVDGAEVVRCETTRTFDEAPLVKGCAFELGFSAGVQAELRDVRVDRDIYYLDEWNWYPESGELRKVPDGQYLVLGDNSPLSNDSRKWTKQPFVDADAIVGKAVLIWWPVGRAALIR